jgi:hypothetical protein
VLPNSDFGIVRYMAVRLVSRVGDVVLLAPVELVVGYGVLANFAAAALAA